MPGERTGMNLCNCGSSDPSLIWLLPSREVTAGISDCPWAISRVCICTPTVLRDGVAAVVFIWGWQSPEPSIWQSYTSYLFHESSWLHPPIWVGSISQTSSASAENSPCSAVLFWRLCPSPSQVRHHHWACRALYLFHQLHCLPHPPHHQILQDPSDCIR